MSSQNVQMLLFCAAVACTIHFSASQMREQGLQIIPEFVPDDCSKTAQPGDEVVVHYTGSLENGIVFDSSRQGDRDPFSFVLGQGKVIPGWEHGIKDMCVGERRKLIIPPHLAYGDQGVPPTIPPQSTLVFETELLAIQSPGVSPVDLILHVVQLLAMPAAVCIAVYYVYDKYQKEPTKRELKEERRGRKSKRN